MLGLVIEQYKGEHTAGESVSMPTSSAKVFSGIDFWSTGVSLLAVVAPILGDDTREVVVLGSRFALRAAFKRFSSSSFATRSCSCKAKAAFYTICSIQGSSKHSSALTSNKPLSIGRMICMHTGAQIPYFSPSSERGGITF